jgi:hypothetical protein
MTICGYSRANKCNNACCYLSNKELIDDVLGRVKKHKRELFEKSTQDL